MGIARRQIRWNGWGWAAHQDALADRDAIWRWLAAEVGMPALLATPARALEDITLPAPSLTPGQIAGFVALLGADRVMQDDYERAFHAGGRSFSDLLRLRGGDLSGAPDAVLYPRGEEEVLEILALAAREKIGVVPYGGGTGSGVTAGRGQITVDLSGMDQVREIDSQAGTVLAEAGITGHALEKSLAAKGFSLAHAPRELEFSSLGGWIAARDQAAAGLTDARLATPAGILETRTTSGPDLKHLLLGSQGAFGIVTQARLHIRRAVAPQFRAFLFRDFSGGIAVLRDAARAGLACETLHLSDGEETRVERAFAGMDRPRGLLARLKEAWTAARRFESGAAMLIASFPNAAAAAQFEALARKLGSVSLGEARARSWLQDHFLTLTNRDCLLDRGLGLETLEFPSGWSALPALHAGVRAALDKAMREHAPREGAHGLALCHLAHADSEGATLRFTALFPRQLENEIAQAQAIHGAALAAARPEELGPLSMRALRGVKNALDPAGIMNPGKLIPPA